MSSVKLSGRGTLGDRQVYRLGYGAMQLAGPGVFGPPKIRRPLSVSCRPRRGGSQSY
jgi:hypothetical protein